MKASSFLLFAITGRWLIARPVHIRNEEGGGGLYRLGKEAENRGYIRRAGWHVKHEQMQRKLYV